MDTTNIIDFLPIYPNINPLTDDIFNPYDITFNNSIYEKKEFYDNRLDEIENFPDEKGELMKHQKIISIFLSSYTPYNSLLLMHEMGTGKTCSSIGAIEQIRSENSTINGAFIFAKGKGILDNYKEELVFKCTKGQYIPFQFTSINTDKKKHFAIKRKIEDYYKFHTFETFAKYLASISDQSMKEKYSNKVIVIDEVHNLRPQDKTEGLHIYHQFYRLTHVIENSKILLLSGTPMKSNFHIMKSVFLLILFKLL